MKDRALIIDKEESDAINTLRMLCVLSVVMIHSSVDHLVPVELSDDILKIHSFMIFIPSLQILFVLSGYLFFLGYSINTPPHILLNGYCTKLKKRVKSLYLPYAIWCVIGFLFGVFITREYSFERTPLEYLQIFTGDSICGHPAGRAMWYVKSLICFSILSPLYFYVVKILKHITPFISFVIIFSDLVPIDNPIINPFTLLGVYLCVIRISLTKFSSYFTIGNTLLIFILLSACSAFFYKLSYPNFIFGLVLFFLISKKYPLNSFFVSSSTFLYFSHLYLSGTIRNVVFSFLPDGVFWYIFDMLLTWGISIVVCFVVYTVFHRFAKPILSILTGDRC